MHGTPGTDKEERGEPPGPIVALAALLALFAFVAGAVRPHTGELSHGFAAYYTSAQLVVAGEDPVMFYDNRWFMEQTIVAGFGETPDIFNVNPPPTALLFLPLQWLSPVDADIVWTALNVAFLAGALVVLIRTLATAGLLNPGRDRAAVALLAALALVFNPVHETFRYGQVYLLLLLLTALAMQAYMLGRHRATGIWLGVLLLAKSSGTLLWLVPLLDGLTNLARTHLHPRGRFLPVGFRIVVWGSGRFASGSCWPRRCWASGYGGNTSSGCRAW